MESSTEHYYNLSKRYLMLVGQWPYQKPKESLFFLIVALFFDINMLVPQVIIIEIPFFLF